MRASLGKERDDERWVKDKRGNWRYRIDTVRGDVFNRRATFEPPGFYHGARINAPHA